MAYLLSHLFQPIALYFSTTEVQGGIYNEECEKAQVLNAFFASQTNLDKRNAVLRFPF